MSASSTLGDDDSTIENLGDSDKQRTNALLDSMIGNNSVVSGWKETFRLSQPTPSLFWRHFVSRCRGSKQLVIHFLTNVSGVVTVCKGSGIRISLQCKRQRLRIL